MKQTPQTIKFETLYSPTSWQKNDISRELNIFSYWLLVKQIKFYFLINRYRNTRNKKLIAETVFILAKLFHLYLLEVLCQTLANRKFFSSYDKLLTLQKSLQDVLWPPGPHVRFVHGIWGLPKWIHTHADSFAQHSKGDSEELAPGAKLAQEGLCNQLTYMPVLTDQPWHEYWLF